MTAAAKDPSGSSNIYYSFLNAQFQIPGKNNKKKEDKKGVVKGDNDKITLQDVIDCNTGNEKFKNKLLLFAKKGVWLNSKKVREIINNPKNPSNLNSLNNVISQIEKIHYTQFAGNGDAYVISKAQLVSEKTLAIAKIIGEGHLDKTNAQEFEWVGKPRGARSKEKAPEPELSIQKAAQRFYELTHFPNPLSVIRASKSLLRQSFLTFLAENGYKINNEKELNIAYKKFIEQGEEEALNLMKTDLVRNNTYKNVEGNLIESSNLIQNEIIQLNEQINSLLKQSPPAGFPKLAQLVRAEKSRLRAFFVFFIVEENIKTTNSNIGLIDALDQFYRHYSLEKLEERREEDSLNQEVMAILTSKQECELLSKQEIIEFNTKAISPQKLDFYHDLEERM